MPLLLYYMNHDHFTAAPDPLQFPFQILIFVHYYYCYYHIIITITITIVDHHHPTLHEQFLCIMVIFKVPVSLQILCAHSENYRCNRKSWYRP